MAFNRPSMSPATKRGKSTCSIISACGPPGGGVPTKATILARSLASRRCRDGGKTAVDEAAEPAGVEAADESDETEDEAPEDAFMNSFPPELATSHRQCFRGFAD